MTITSRVRHLIEITNDRGTLAFDFESHDIGCTQGTTLTIADPNGHGIAVVIARYRPHTRYWSTALEIAEQVLVKAVARALEPASPWSTVKLGRELETVISEEGLTLWDGKDPNEDWQQ
ncbi:hypothetical protein [Kitasatospora sp. NPDC086791]|uniref:hypothetical protein n=1 Tax=Kitasatospora sp. NPDC086791 TaxID=3155178 RepID=UPI00341DB3AE